MKKALLILVLLPIAIIVFAPGLNSDLNTKIEKWLSSSAELTQGNLSLALEINGIKASQIVEAQSCLETGYFQSSLCTRHNNLFGMKRPLKRLTTAIGATSEGFAIYDCWYDSVKDMKLFQEFYQSRGRDLTNYMQFLSSIDYAQDPYYLFKIRRICITSR